MIAGSHEPLLKQQPSRKSVAMKRNSCGWSEDFMLEVEAVEQKTGMRSLYDEFFRGYGAEVKLIWPCSPPGLDV